MKIIIRPGVMSGFVAFASDDAGKELFRGAASKVVLDDLNARRLRNLLRFLKEKGALTIDVDCTNPEDWDS